MREVFVDTSAWIALVNKADSSHQEISRAFQHQLDRGTKLVTSNHVVGETRTFLSRFAGHEASRQFMKTIRRSATLKIEFAGGAIETKAHEFLDTHLERPYSFVDAVSFVLMRQLKISEVLTLDSDFAAAGFVELLPG